MELSLPNQLGEFPIGGQKLKLVGNTLGLTPDGNTVDLSLVQPSNPLTIQAKSTDAEARITIRNTNTSGPTKLELTNNQATYTLAQSADKLQLSSSTTLAAEVSPTGGVTFAGPLKVTTPSTKSITPLPSSSANRFGTLRPVFWDTATNSFTIPTSSLVRFFRVATPSVTGNQVTITDEAGNTYNSDEWVCTVAGFANTGDRTYGCFTIPYAGAPWKVQYDQAGGAGSVWILAISNALMPNATY